MSWFTTEGKSSLHAIFSRTSYHRNLSGSPFTKRMGDKSLEAVAKKIDSLLTKNGFRAEGLPDTDELYRLSLAEKGFVGKEFLSSSTKKSIYFNEPCSLSVAIGGKDLISITSLLSGLAISDTRNIASGAEELLDGAFEFAYSEETGYYSSIPSLCGSGAVFSAMLYLPAAKTSGEIASLRASCADGGASLEPAFIYPDNCGDLYRLSLSPSHLSDENTAAESFSAIIEGIIEREISIERMIFEESAKIIIDNAWRAFAQLLYARRLDERDLLSLSSSVRFAICAASGNAKLPPLEVKELNYLLGEGLNASIALTRPNITSEDEIAEARAEIVSKLVYTASGSTM